MATNIGNVVCMNGLDMGWCLSYRVEARCSTTKARASVITLAHGNVKTPVFMPVGTQGTMKGVTTEQLRAMDFEIILANTYHLARV